MQTMYWVKATLRFLHDWRHADELAREVETELRFHVEMRARANIDEGMKPDDARLAALTSFGDFDLVKDECCEIRRSLPFDSKPLRIGFYIAIACFAGVAAIWAVNMPHDNFIGVLRQLIFIAVLTCLFVGARRNKTSHL
jgi:hypothetical protein